MSVIDRVQTLDRLLPFIDLPPGPVDKLTELDARSRRSTTRSWASWARISPPGASTGGRRHRDKARNAQAKLDGVSDRLNAVATDLTALQTDLDSISGKAKTAINLGVIGAILLFVYLALLHVLLFRVSRRCGWARGRAAGRRRGPDVRHGPLGPRPDPHGGPETGARAGPGTRGGRAAPAAAARPTGRGSRAPPAPEPLRRPRPADDATQPVETPDNP